MEPAQMVKLRRELREMDMEQLMAFKCKTELTIGQQVTAIDKIKSGVKPKSRIGTSLTRRTARLDYLCEVIDMVEDARHDLVCDTCPRREMADPRCEYCVEYR